MTNRCFFTKLELTRIFAPIPIQHVTGIFPSSDGVGMSGPQNPASHLIHTDLKVIDVNENERAFDGNIRNVLHHAALTAWISQSRHSFPRH